MVKRFRPHLNREKQINSDKDRRDQTRKNTERTEKSET